MEKIKGQKRKIFYKIIVTIVSLIIISFVLKVAPNYIRNDITGKTNLVINNNNVTKNLKADIILENDVVYISKDDIDNFFDGTIYYDSKYDQIITTSNTKVAALPINKKTIKLNGADMNIYAPTIKKDNKYYLPFSEICKKVYNAELNYIKNTDTVVINSLDKELIYANSSKNNNIKYKATVFSKTVDKIKKGDNVTVVSNDNNGWSKITTQNGKIGYVKTNTLANQQKERENFELEKQISGKVSIVWDYFSEYASAPQRQGKIEGVNVASPTFFALVKSGKGVIAANVKQQGLQYIDWAHSNGYKVWPILSNNSMKETTSEILNDYNLRQNLINNIVKCMELYNIDGINLDFENVYQADKDAYSRLVIELAPRLRDINKVLSVDVTAPDGSEDWSLCFDRNAIGKAADYEVFMAYDQHGVSSAEAGSVAGYDWVETNINKFLKQEEVKADKLILGMPFYTRIWATGETLKSEVVSMKDTYSKIPSDAKIQWLDAEKQNYVEYSQKNILYKIWIEDKKSIEEKLSLVKDYNLIGAAYWEKDRESDDVWPVISNALDIK